MRYGLETMLQPWRDKIENGAKLVLVRDRAPAIGGLLALYTPMECANYFTTCG